MYYQIKEKLTPCELEDIKNRDYKYVALVSWVEFEEYKQYFDMGIDLDMSESSSVTRIQVNYDSLTGCISVPDREDINKPFHTFAFAIDEKGVVFINDDGTAQKIINRILNSRKWKFPCLERFLYDFLEGIVRDDQMSLEYFSKEMDDMEDRVLDDNLDEIMERLADLRGAFLILRSFYGQLIAVSEELEENENHFFEAGNLRFFRLFTERVERLQNIVSNLRDHSMQIRDLYHSKLEEKQNKKMAFLAAITMIFTPLTLITSWFGMNFKYMPELNQPWAYPIVFAVCLTIAITCILIFKHKKWF